MLLFLSVEVECTGLYLNECHKGPWFADSSLCFFYFMRISGLLTCMNLCARNFKCCNYKMAHRLGILLRLLTLTCFQRNSGISILGFWHFGKKRKSGYWGILIYFVSLKILQICRQTWFYKVLIFYPANDHAGWTCEKYNIGGLVRSVSTFYLHSDRKGTDLKPLYGMLEEKVTFTLYNIFSIRAKQQVYNMCTVQVYCAQSCTHILACLRYRKKANAVDNISIKYYSYVMCLIKGGVADWRSVSRLLRLFLCVCLHWNMNCMFCCICNVVKWNFNIKYFV